MVEGGAELTTGCGEGAPPPRYSAGDTMTRDDGRLPVMQTVLSIWWT